MPKCSSSAGPSVGQTSSLPWRRALAKRRPPSARPRPVGLELRSMPRSIARMPWTRLPSAWSAKVRRKPSTSGSSGTRAVVPGARGCSSTSMHSSGLARLPRVTRPVCAARSAELRSSAWLSRALWLNARSHLESSLATASPPRDSQTYRDAEQGYSVDLRRRSYRRNADGQARASTTQSHLSSQA